MIKIETCEALHERLARPSDRHRVLCGDLNLPRGETMGRRGDHVRRGSSGDRSSAGTGASAEILPGLEEWDLRDVFRALHGFERQDASWVLHTRARRKAGLRLDHILASASLRPQWCDYHHGWREEGLSDHSALEAIFEPS